VKIAVNGGVADCAGVQKIEMTGIATEFPEDPEPEFVDVNANGEIVVTMQENNHIVVIGADGAVAGHFNAGSVEVAGIDAKRDGKIDPVDTKPAVPREPDGVAWIDTDHFATANEGDWKGGTRSWTIFRKDGTVVWDSGASLERAMVAMGHYPEHRSHTKGIELESVKIATFGGVPMAFVVSERASLVAVYDLTDLANPVLKQILPSGISPEGIVAIPARNLLATANEVDLREDGGPSGHVMVYELAEGTAAYPTITSEGSDPLIGWGALSGLAADPAEAGKLYAVSDSIYPKAPSIYTIDATQTPAKITAKVVLTRDGDVAQKIDLEGIVADGEGGFWLGNEGDFATLTPNAIFHVDATGAIDQEIGLPADLVSNQLRWGIEGITLKDGVLWLAMQRTWKDDPEGMVKLVSYNIAEETWGAVHYPLDAPTEGAWVGLSEITWAGDWVYVIERDNQIADKAATKKLYRIPASAMVPAELGGTLPVVTKELVRDLVPDLKGWGGYVVDKVEGFAIDAAGTGWVITDNDGVDDSSGETFFWSIGTMN
jgi:hypothetical protein